MGPSDFIKDLWYIIFLPHYNFGIMYALWFSIFGPTMFIWFKCGLNCKKAFIQYFAIDLIQGSKDFDP